MLPAGTTDLTGMNVTPAQFDILAQLLDVSELRHRVLSQNIANVNTPGYHRLDVSFEDALARLAGDLSFGIDRGR